MPTWHSLRAAWLDENAFHRHYAALRTDDVPFAQDCLGDQFLLRSGEVIRLRGETGELSKIGMGLHDFLAAVQADPVGFLSLQPLLRFQSEGGTLQPGQLLSAAPPFCCLESGADVSLRAVAALDRQAFLVDFSKEIADVPDGGKIRIRLNP